MEEANQLARRAADYEAQRNWEAAAKAHDEAALAYKSIDTFAFDPVATLTLSSLTNRHMRWAENCRRENDRPEPSIVRKQSPAPREHSKQTDVRSNELRTDTGQNEKSEGEFEDFWQYMQNWLANPAAYTRPTAMQGRHNSSIDTPPSAHAIMESFYVVGSNPDQGASIHASAMTPIDRASPLPAILEDEPTQDTEPHTPSDTLASENQRLVRLVQHLNERIRTLETAAHENSMLKSSIFNFREEFQRHANVVSLPRFHDAGHGSRRENRVPDSAADDQIRQLEVEVQRLELETTKQKAQVTKYRERWERLKESAKRKRQQQEQLAGGRIQSPG